MSKHPEAVIVIYISRVLIVEVQPAQHPVTKAVIQALVVMSLQGALLIPAIMEVVKKK